MKRKNKARLSSLLFKREVQGHEKKDFRMLEFEFPLQVSSLKLVVNSLV